MKLVVMIVNKHDADLVVKSCQSLKLLEPVTFIGEGTAPTELRELLSLADSDKEVVFALLSDKDIKPLMEHLEHEKNFVKRGKGVAFAVDLNTMSARTFELLKNQLTKE